MGGASVVGVEETVCQAGDFAQQFLTIKRNTTFIVNVTAQSCQQIYKHCQGLSSNSSPLSRSPNLPHYVCLSSPSTLTPSGLDGVNASSPHCLDSPSPNLCCTWIYGPRSSSSSPMATGEVRTMSNRSSFHNRISVHKPHVLGSSI